MKTLWVCILPFNSGCDRYLVMGEMWVAQAHADAGTTASMASTIVCDCGFYFVDFALGAKSLHFSTGEEFSSCCVD